eukprot:TRINITY_DN7522_c0_g1_i3.p1 TRINITY_DN7522_c0_g1~~TRINITY_DN7522_c0_g1_i3.p1  ORF type:complete len:347 (-),score=33.01 TRINITY_DN7522_c0_g1_i3:151-1068(-)
MQILQTKHDMRKYSTSQKQQNKKIGFVPTMGYLHEGHLSLIKIARQHADVVVVSIYVNPTQFAKGEDFDVYPRNAENDRKKLQELGVEVCFEPASLYGTDDSLNVVGANESQEGTHQTFVQTENLEKGLCGISRPHFFRGVATIVTKLFNIVQPDVAVFGLKDYQQFRVVSTMVRELDFPIKIIPGPIAREADGLAMSSRNARLSEDSRKAAVCISQALFAAKKDAENGNNVTKNQIVPIIAQKIQKAGGRVDYVEVVDAKTLQPVQDVLTQVSVIAVAAFFNAKDRGDVRLIDNIVVGDLEQIM